MKGIDEPTARYYAANARELVPRYAACQGGVSRYFRQSFPPGARVLDVGAGSGRDLKILLDMGYDAWGVEPCAELIAAAIEAEPALLGRLTRSALPALEGVKAGDYDGVVCSAVLMHVPEDDLAEAVRAIRRVVREGGRALVSLPIPGDAAEPSRRDDDGRLFSGFDAERCVAMLAGEGFRLVEHWDDADGLGRGGRRWVTLLMACDGEALSNRLLG